MNKRDIQKNSGECNCLHGCSCKNENMSTYPEMNAKIIGILRVSDNPTSLYAAQRIEELEAEVKRFRELLLGILPHAKGVSCEHQTENDAIEPMCCEWTRIVKRIKESLERTV